MMPSEIVLMEYYMNRPESVEEIEDNISIDEDEE